MIPHLNVCQLMYVFDRISLLTSKTDMIPIPWEISNRIMAPRVTETTVHIKSAPADAKSILHLNHDIRRSIVIVRWAFHRSHAVAIKYTAFFLFSPKELTLEVTLLTHNMWNPELFEHCGTWYSKVLIQEADTETGRDSKITSDSSCTSHGRFQFF